MYRTLYDDITGGGRAIEYQDRHALGELAVTIIEMQELRKHIREHGVMMEVQGDRNMIMKRNGSCDVLDRKTGHYNRLIKAFGMAPEYRPKVQAAGFNEGTNTNNEGDDWGDV